MITRRNFISVMSLCAAATLVKWRPTAHAAAGKAAPGAYDAIVVGAGLGGLSCAAYLAVNGYRPLVLEKHYAPGGYASSFKRSSGAEQRYTCEVSLHATAAGAPALQKLYGELGVRDRLTFVPHAHTWCSRFPDRTLEIPRGLGAFRDMLIGLYPAEKQGLLKFFAYWQNLLDEMERFHRDGMPVLKILFPLRYPTMWDIRNRTLGEVVNLYLNHPQLKFLIGQTWGYYGLPPARLSAFYYLLPFGEYLSSGAYYLKGTSQALSDALADVITNNGGVLLLNERVTEISVGETGVRGVRTASGKQFSARAVVSNAAFPQTLAMLSNSAAVPASYRVRTAAYSPSLSSFVVWLGLRTDITKIERRAEVNFYPDYDAEAGYAASVAGDPDRAGVACMIYDNLVPGFSPEGKSTMSIMFLCGYEPWRRFEKDYEAGRKDAYNREKNRVADRLIARVEEQLIAGLSGMIEMREAATPLSNRRFTGNTAGAIYGFDQTRENTFMNRLDVRTPVKGLYLAGAWSNPGGGHEGALLGGKAAFRSLVEDLR
ncbi:MAG: NAD(P)/FAD-dependent oxidoreductase [Syntrophaceae bacterium]|jgi:phytoene dehydrogenase-like protein|nr:NAD(P)/FAD-dependent oxidoreductase [Syntrophaceae bacterium]